MHNLNHFLTAYSPDIIFLSEPQIYSCDVGSLMDFFRDRYSFLLNSEDKYDDALPLRRSHAHGGTMMMWRNDLHPFIEPVTVTTSAFLPIIFHPPGGSLSANEAREG